MWPLQPAPLTAYTTHGLNLLTPGLLEQNEAQQNIQFTAIAPQVLQPTNTNYLTPQFLTNQQPYFAYNNPYFQTPINQYDYTTGQQILPQYYAAFPPVTANVLTTNDKDPVLVPRIGTTKRPVFRDREPTTRRPQSKIHIKPLKLQVKVADFKSDVALLRAVEKINPQYVIEDIINVPGKHIYSGKTTQNKSTNKQKQAANLEKSKETTIDIPGNTGVRVEATGKTSTTGNIPEIPFDSYFLPYFSQGQQLQKQNGKKPTALILEPHSKAIVGNGGTAISTPISKAYLKRGVSTNVYFNPESVAIAGVGGKAHAQADLELDLIK